VLGAPLRMTILRIELEMQKPVSSRNSIVFKQLALSDTQSWTALRCLYGTEAGKCELRKAYLSG
jgi:hypothetical protein